MAKANIDRDDVINKLSIVNKIIRNGYDYTYATIELIYKDFCRSIKDHNYFQLREELMRQLCPLVY